METSDDEGEAASTLFTKASLIVLTVIPFALYKPRHAVPHLPFGAPMEVKADSVIPAQEPPKRIKEKKKLYITFDDGPNKGTRNVLHIVREEQVPVSFFVVGEHVSVSPGRRRLWDSLKTLPQVDLCNHSYTHAHGRYGSFYQEPDSVVRDFWRTHDSLRLENTIARTPGRNIWRIDSLRFSDNKKSAAAADSLQKAGFLLLGWDLEWPFDHHTMNVSMPAEKMVAQIDSVFTYNRTKQKDHLVLLAHDQMYQKSEDSLQLRLFFQLLKQKEEYALSLVRHYPGLDRKSIGDTLIVKK